MTGFALRRLGAGDALGYRAIRLVSLRAHPECFGASWESEAAQPEAFFAERLTENFVLGAFTGTEWQGVIGLHVSPSAKHRHNGSVWGMYVRPAARGTGLGAALLAGVIAEARGRVEELRLGVVATNIPALRLYRASGFREYGTEPRALKIGDRYFDEVLMFLPLAGERPQRG